MSRYDFIRFGGFVNWADEDTDTFRKMKVCLPVKEPVEDDTKIGLISTDEDNPEEIAVSYSVRAAELIPWTDSFQEGLQKGIRSSSRQCTRMCGNPGQHCCRAPSAPGRYFRLYHYRENVKILYQQGSGQEDAAQAKNQCLHPQRRN